ncbi:MAG: D-glycerate dehydrogenase [Deltaproteobacteria bacterium]|nr:MAG: D-glycerate dehydrogenase [Deltaproteobacteria bacterium]
MQKPRVFIARRLALDPRQVLGAGVEIDLHDSESALPRAELLRRAHESSGLVATLADKVDGELLDAAPRLRIVANHAVGYDNVDVPACTRRSVWVTNTPDVLTDATADLTWALILALARRLREGERLLRSGGFSGWAPTMLLGRELRGRTLGIFGYGRIGQAVARRAEGFGMRVLFNTRGGGVSFEELLEESDVLSIHVPLSTQTRHAFGPAELLRMKRGALLINTARGPIVDEAALVAALAARHLGGAGLDVFENEPAVHPGLAGRDDVVLLPHLGSATQEAREAMARIALSEVERVLRGERPLHAVNEVP